MSYGLIPPVAALAGFFLYRDRRSLRWRRGVASLLSAFAITWLVFQMHYAGPLRPSTLLWLPFAQSGLLIATPGVLLVTLVPWGRLRMRLGVSATFVASATHLGFRLLADDLLLPFRDFLAITGVLIVVTVSAALGAVAGAAREQARGGAPPAA